MINILIVDDSKTEAQLFKHLFESQSDMRVIGCAKDGREAVEMAARLKPDLITMDLEMPVMDGHTATRLIMSQHPVPIVVISSKLDATSVDMTYLALDAGAVSVLAKPMNIGSKQFERDKRQIIDTVRSMAEIKVIKRRFNVKVSDESVVIPITVTEKSRHFELVVIGTSVGGPQTLKTIFSQLSDFPVPIVIVQHMTKGFMEGFTRWLNNNISLTAKNVANEEILQPGVIYFAGDDVHFTVQRHNQDLVAKLRPGEPVAGFCPSITVLMQSVAETCGKDAIGILLTGMGNDGAQGLLALKNAGAHTFIQDPKSCVVFGMGGVAESLGAVDKVVEMNQIAAYLKQLFDHS